MVFDPAAAPRDRTAFLTWFEQQTEWSEGHSYDDPAVTSENLATWYAAMRRAFPNMIGPDAYDIDADDENPRVTDYSIGKSVIYAAFAWSQTEAAYAVMRRLAAEHRVGFFNVSATEGEIWFPPADRQSDTTAISGLTLTLEGQPDFQAPSIALIEAAVDWLRPSIGPSFLILEWQAGSYAQVGGGENACTVELREVQAGGFQHWAAGIPGGDASKVVKIPGNGFEFQVRANEVLDNDTVKRILVAFAQNHAKPDMFAWRDMTADFAAQPAR